MQLKKNVELLIFWRKNELLGVPVPLIVKKYKIKTVLANYDLRRMFSDRKR